MTRLTGRLRQAVRGRRPAEYPHVDLAVDRDGQRYTTHTFATWADPWRGATILTPSVVRRLRETGLLPLTPVVVEGQR